MKIQRVNYPIKLMARVLQVSRSGFYAWLNRAPSTRTSQDEIFKPLIQKAHDLGRETYGSPRIQEELAGKDVMIGRDHITRLRKAMGLKCIQKKKFKATTNSNHCLPIEANLLDQKFDVAEPGMVVGTDITYIWTDEGWLYLAGLKDFCSKEIIGYAMSERMTKELVLAALAKAVRSRKIRPGCIHHSDRGAQYCALSYQAAVKAAGMRPSMSRKGNCYDNAPTESLWGCLKQEMVHHRRFRTRAEAQAAIQEWIEVFYNRVRRHSKIGNVAPATFSETFRQERKSA
jgi:transposase InsO family protein